MPKVLHTHTVKPRSAIRKLDIPFEENYILGKDVKEKNKREKLFRYIAIFLKCTGLIDRI